MNQLSWIESCGVAALAYDALYPRLSLVVYLAEQPVRSRLLSPLWRQHLIDIIGNAGIILDLHVLGKLLGSQSSLSGRALFEIVAALQASLASLLA